MTTATATTSSNRVTRDFEKPLWRRVLVSRETGVVALLLVVVIYSMVAVRGFGQPITVNYLLLDVAPILLIALPMTLIMITGEIDLSVGSMVGLASVVTGAGVNAGLPFEVAALLALLVGAVGGAFNGFLVTVVGLPSLAVTIGTLALFRGLAVGLLGTTAVTDFPEAWSALAKAKISGTTIPYIMVPFLILLVIFVIVLQFTPFGRGIYAIGMSKEAARFSGVHVERTKFLLFVLAGLVSAFAGIYYTLRFGSARGDNATGLELQVIAAVVLGGVSVFGGRGQLYGVVAAVLLIGVLSSALRLANVTSDVINVITGVLLVLSVVGASALTWLQRRRQRPSRPPRTAASAAS
ncbi:MULTISPECIES: ABC transporter permease [unclassified Microbacterium]|uniref:ABC transporter permease n=1 Tax=unclassified Microbacterium TaxID=2609290 RepID=UPI000CFDD1F1|nr:MULTISPECIES: ABC transporter permease [unclassified Microbacterium]PQZ60240.1 ATPase [Microbacterium sp. MYb43]PQZ76891.1 ATPase [Microbacterium sp. MYb40]PRB23283.1 ATPase [Microbacterium sp. MYb54]PRB28187.1 ATPase [Microbacterium sp. MYb50]PRB66238.1 ATPase [Microbacterium sp. MYb24]